MRVRESAWLLAVVVGCHSRAVPVAPTLAAPGSNSAVAAPVLTDADSPIPVSPADPSWGSPTALVTLVVFSDFQCPYCSRVEPALTQVRQSYGPQNVRIVWKNQPLSFHERARPAAEAAMGVFALGGNDAFWKMHTTLFQHQTELTDANLLAWGAQSGVDGAALRAGLESGRFRAKVDRDHEEALKAGVQGTPATFVNGILVSGAQPFESFRAVVDEELEKAESVLRQGIPRTELYAALSRSNHEAPPEAPEPPPADVDDTSTVWRVPVGTSPTHGPADALVTIVEFSDYQCPFCKRVQPTLEQIAQSYGNKVRFVWKDQPLSFHPFAMRAAIFAREARAQKGDAGFWSAHDKLFELTPALDKPDLERAARALGLNLKKVQNAVKSDKFKSAVEEDIALAEDVRATGTPHFFVNGRRISGAQPFKNFARLIDAEIEKSEALIKAGTPASTLYEKIIENGVGPGEPERKSVAAATHATPSQGPASAKVTVTVFSDFQCPFCARAEPTLAEIRALYGNRVRIVARELPLPSLHPGAPLAAEAAREAFSQQGNSGYWKMRDALFAAKTMDRAALEAVAQQVGLDLPRFRKALDLHAHRAVVEADAAAAAAAQITGTPAFLINDYSLSGAQPLAKFRRLIDRALADKAQNKP